MGPIEPAAITAATLLATKALEAFGGKAGETTWVGMSRLVALVRRTVTDHRQAESALAEVERHPDDQARIRELGELLAAFAARDAAFHRELASLVADARRDPTIGPLATRVYGQAQVGQLLNVGQARDIYIQPPASPAPVRELSWPTQGRPVANLPPRNLAFTGRGELLDRLHQQLTTPTAVAAVAVTALADKDATPAGVAPDAETSLAEVRAPRVLHGLGGVGKTQLAAEYAYRHASDYRIRWWIPAGQPPVIPGQLVALARQLGIPEQAEQTETVAALLAELGRRGEWLLVFDNAEDPHDLHPYWPSTDAGGRVLVTSRNPNWQPLAATLSMDVWPRADAIAFLQRRAGLDPDDADALAEALGDLPLALEQAAAYLQQTGTAPGGYLDLLATRAGELFALGRLATSEQTIATTWTVSLHRLRDQTPGAEDLLALCAFLAADDIPRALAAEHPDRLPGRLAATVRDPLAYQQAIAELRRYSLLKTSPDGQALSVHRLVQVVTRQQFDPTQEQQWATAALHLLRAAFPARNADPDAWPDYARLLPHVVAVTGHTSAGDIDVDETGWLLTEAGWYLWRRGDYRQARSLFERALSIREARLGADHPDTAQSLSNLGGVLAEQQRDLDRARSLLERAVAIREARLGPDDPATANSLRYLADVLAAQGDLDRARTLHERALGICEARLGPDDPATAQSLNNLALTLAYQGDFHGARTLFERVLSIREARLGPDDPATAQSFNNLASALAEQGDLDGARTLFERTLGIYEARLGPDHPATAWSLNNLALVSRDQGDLQGARPCSSAPWPSGRPVWAPTTPTRCGAVSGLRRL